ALDGHAQLLHHRRVEAVALVRAVQPDKGDLAVQLVGDRLFFAHKLLLELLLVQRGNSSPRCAMTFRWISLVPPPIMPMMAWRNTCSISPTGAPGVPSDKRPPLPRMSSAAWPNRSCSSLANTLPIAASCS